MTLFFIIIKYFYYGGTKNVVYRVFTVLEFKIDVVIGGYTRMLKKRKTLPDFF